MKIDTFPRFFFGFWQHEKLPSFGKFRRPAEIFLFFCGDVTASTSCTLPQSAIPPYEAGAEIWAVGFLFCDEQPLNILEVVGLRAPTAVAECHRHSAKSRPSLRIERALRSGRWDSICCGKQPLNILEVVGLRAPTAVETCHWHVSKSRLSNPTFGAKKQQPSEWMAVVLAEKVGFEPTWRVTANSISSRARYDHFDTSPYRACLTGAYLFYHAMTENTSAFSEIVIIFISPGRHPADNGLPHSGKA